MILGHSELRKLIQKNKLITGLSKRELENPEGCVFDLRLDKVFKLKGKAFLGIDERETPDTIEVASFNPKKRSSFVIKPGKYYLVKTIEEVNLPENIAVIFKPRTTTYRGRLILRTGIANPGYHGPLYFGLKNEGNIDFEIEMGARFVQAFFLEVKGKPVNKYRGQWQGGRDTTKGREKQI
ncbi:2'-deoxycytidine 5'-triphosphate deaminase [Candidatus Woesebacteria bacterium]|nr:2'-deoxycytidine 5'-triphosphate deaminase [Candidatus Woesebacteria bacterium]